MGNEVNSILRIIFPIAFRLMSFGCSPWCLTILQFYLLIYRWYTYIIRRSTLPSLFQFEFIPRAITIVSQQYYSPHPLFLQLEEFRLTKYFSIPYSRFPRLDKTGWKVPICMEPLKARGRWHPWQRDNITCTQLVLIGESNKYPSAYVLHFIYSLSITC